MPNLRNKKLTHNARLLRKNMTKEEKRLWYDFFKQLPIKRLIGKKLSVIIL